MDTIANLLVMLLQIYSWAIIIYILMSWIPNARESGVGQMLSRICEPYLEPFRKIIPPLGMIDISPIVAIIALHLAQSGVIAVFRMF